MKIPWKRIAQGLGGAMMGAALGAVLGFVETYLIILSFANTLGLRDQEGLIIFAGAPFGAIHGGIVGFLVGLGVRNPLGWVLGTLVGLGLWAPVFFWGTRYHSNIILLLVLAMPLLCGGLGTALQACFTTRRN
jgi:hypothetical protein